MIQHSSSHRRRSGWIPSIALGTCIVLIACILSTSFTSAFLNVNDFEFPLESSVSGSDPDTSFEIQSSILPPPPPFPWFPGAGDNESKKRLFNQVIVSRSQNTVDYYLETNPTVAKTLTNVSNSRLYFDLPNYQLSSGSTFINCKYYNSKNVAIGSVVRASNTTSGNVLTAQCPFPTGFNWATTSSGIRVELTNINAISLDSSSAQCQSSALIAKDFFTGIFLDGFLGTFIGLFGASVRIGEATYCCPNFGVRYLVGTTIRYAASADRCTVHGDGGGGVVDAPVRFRGLTVTASPQTERTEITLTTSFITTTDLSATGRTTPSPRVPAYFWLHLPGYSQVSAHVAPRCEIRVNDRRISYLATPTAPEVLVRPITSAHGSGASSESIAVLCALGEDIPANSKITLTVTRIVSPRSAFFNPACWVSSLITTSSSCCGITVDYRRGNSPINPPVYTSEPALKCPLYAPKKGFFTYPNGERLELDPRLGDVQFSPTEVEMGQVVNNANYQFTPETEVPAQTKMTVHFPGYRLNNDNQRFLRMGIGGSEDYYEVPATTTVDEFGVLIFAIVAPVPLPKGIAIIFIAPPLLPTFALPTADQCQVFGSSTSFDGVCCSEFRIVLYIANVLFIAHASKCSVLPPDVPVRCDGEHWSYTKCCTITSRRNSSAEVRDRCLAYECGDSESDLFLPNRCCQHEAYRSNAECCLGAFFCINECCGQTGQNYFEPEQCCLPENVEELEQAGVEIEDTCQCYAELNEGQFDEFDPIATPEESCCVDPLVEQTDYCECRDLFDRVLNPSTGLYEYVVRPGVVNYNVECCDYEPFQNTLFCECYTASITPGSTFDTTACCVFNAFATLEQCIGEGQQCGCQCDGDVTCCRVNRQEIDIANINSTNTNIGVINAGRVIRSPSDGARDGEEPEGQVSPDGEGNIDGVEGDASGLRLIIDNVLGFRPW